MLTIPFSFAILNLRLEAVFLLAKTRALSNRSRHNRFLIAGERSPFCLEDKMYNHKEYMKKYNKLNADKMKEYHKKNREKIIKLTIAFRFGGNKEKALERDNYTCQSCGSKERLCVHHKDGKGRYSKIKNNSLDNLITLCICCHGKLHNGNKRTLILENLNKMLEVVK